MIDENIWGERLADGLPQGVGVVGVAAHDVAVLVGVEVSDRQGLLVGEHVVADLLQRALFDGDDQPLPQPCGEDAGRVQASHQGQGAGQRPPVGVALADERKNVAVDQRLQEQRRTRLGRRSYEDAQHDDDDPPPVLQDVAEDAFGGAGCGLAHRRLGAGPALHGVFVGFFRHCHSPLTAVLQAAPGSWSAIHRWTGIHHRFRAVRRACRQRRCVRRP